MQKTYLFLYLKTGGGHLAPARSLANYIKAKHGNKANAVLWDGFTGVNKCIKYCVEDGYRLSQAGAIWTYEALYALNKIPLIARLNTMLLSFFIIPHLQKQITKENPSRIVIFHFFLIRPVMQILRKNRLEIPVTVVVTDPFTAHPIWFLDPTPEFIVFSERVKKYCVKKGVHTNAVSVFPFILDEKFTQPLNPVLSKSIKENLGFTPGKRLILILGGGDGIPKGGKILKKFMKENPAAEVAIVCGRNHALYKKAWKIKSKHNFDSLKIYGFVDFIYELINIADVVITKCGASTFMEILMSGKIPIINNYIWEQEKGNMQFIRDNALGIYEKNIAMLPAKTNEILYNQALYNVYKENIQKLTLQNGTPYICEFLINKEKDSYLQNFEPQIITGYDTKLLKVM